VSEVLLRMLDAMLVGGFVALFTSLAVRTWCDLGEKRRRR